MGDDDEPFMDCEVHMSQDLESFFPNDNECIQLAREDVDNEIDVTMDPNSYMNLD